MATFNRQVTVRSDFDQTLPGIVTHLTGKVGLSEIEAWARDFQECRDQNFSTGGFKLLVNTYGYEPESIEVHKQWRAALVSYCQNRCLAIAFVNHDPHQVSQLQKTATATHNFFLDIQQAYEWLKNPAAVHQ